MNKIGKPALSLSGSQFQKILEVVRNKLFDWVAQLPDEQLSPSPITEMVTFMPDKITLKWLWQFVPIQFWMWFVGVVAAAFVAGIFVGQISVVRELIGKKTPASSPLQRENPTPSPQAIETPVASPTASNK